MEEMTGTQIARLASEGLKSILDMPGFAPDQFTVDDVRDRRPLLEGRLAALGGANGIRGEYWLAWLELVRSGGGDPLQAARKLHFYQASWLVMWCFAAGLEDLGCQVFDALVQDLDATETGANLHHAAIELCLLWHLTRGRVRDAARVGKDCLRKFGEPPRAAVLTSVARHLAGEMSLEDARRAVARLRPRPGGDFVDIIAPAHHFLGDHDKAASVLALYNVDSPIFPPVERVMREIFGERFNEARAQPAPPPLPRLRWRGLALERSARRTAHEFAPAGVPVPACPGCASDMVVWFRIDVTKEKKIQALVPGWYSFVAVACLRCDFWMLRHDFAHRPDGRVELLEVQAADPKLAKQHGELPTPAPQFVKTKPAPATLDDMPLEGDCQLGGNPAWIQAEEDVRCPTCDSRMAFILRLSSPNSFEDCPQVGSGSAALYYFACAACRVSARIAQWT